MKQRSRLLGLLLALVVFAAAACGDDDEAATTTTSDGDAADLEGEKLEVAAIWTGAEQERFTKVLEAFEADTGADITYTPAGDDMAVFLEGRIARRGAPDVAIIAQPALLRKLAGDGNLVALGSDAEAVVDESFDPGLKEALSVDGELYGVPFKTANKSLLWFNKTVLDDAGVEPPGTWEEFQETAQTVADSGVGAISLGADVGWPLTDWFENVLLWTAGPEAYDQLANGELAWTDEKVKTALTRLGEIWTGDFVLGGLATAASTSFDESITNTWTKPAGFLFEGDFVANNIRQEDVATVGEDADFVPFPAIGEGTAGDRVLLGGDFPVLFQDSEAGQALMAYLASAEAQEIWASEGGFLSSNTDVEPSVYPDDVTRRAAELIQNAELTRFDLSDLVPPEFGATSGRGMWKLFQDFLKDPSNVDGTATALDEAAA